MTRAIRIHQTGGPEVLRWEEVSVPPPAEGQALVRHTAVGVNFIDTYHRGGLYPLPLPSGLGSEAAGVIEALGPGVESALGLSVGQRVAYAGAPPGSYSERRLVPADRLVPLPDGISDELAAAALLKGMTAQYLIRRIHRVARGESILVHAAAGGVGQILCQWAHALGATVIGTASTDEKAAIARDHGCDHPIVYTRDDFVKRTRELTGGDGVRVVYDSVGKTTFLPSLDAIRPMGLMVSYGNASGPPPPLDVLTLSQKGSLFLTRPTLFHYTARREDLLQSAQELFAILQSKTIQIEIHQRIPLARAAEAHQSIESRRTTGSTILIP